MSRVFLSIGPITIYWYSILILTAFLIGYALVYHEFKKEKMSLAFFSDYFFYLIPIVIVGARLYYVIFEWSSYASHPLSIFAVWEGGLAIHGGVLAGLIFTIFYTKKHKINTLKLFDIIAPALILGQAIGRWGNFFNQEAFGPEMGIEMFHRLHIPQFIIDQMYITDHLGTFYRTPTFFFESLACFSGFLLIYFLRRRKKIYLGISSGLYFIIYGTTRFFIEALRTDSLWLGPIKVAQLVSIIMVLAGIAFLIYAYKTKRYYHEGEIKNE